MSEESTAAAAHHGLIADSLHLSSALERITTEAGRGIASNGALPPVERIAAWRQLAATAQQAPRDRVVPAARAAGHTWAQIGHALGVSRQAASQRYRRAVQGGPRPRGRTRRGPVGRGRSFARTVPGEERQQRSHPT